MALLESCKFTVDTAMGGGTGEGGRVTQKICRGVRFLCEKTLTLISSLSYNIDLRITD